MKRSLTTREQPHRRKNPASRGRTTAHAGEQLATDASRSPAGGNVAKLINSKFGHLHETKHLAAAAKEPGVLKRGEGYGLQRPYIMEARTMGFRVCVRTTDRSARLDFCRTRPVGPCGQTSAQPGPCFPVLLVGALHSMRFSVKSFTGVANPREDETGHFLSSAAQQISGCPIAPDFL